MQLEGYEDDAHPNFLCGLHRALYGLKQARKANILSLLDFKFPMQVFYVRRGSF